MSITTQPSTTTPADERGLRPTLEELWQNTRLLIRLRWVAGTGILLSTVFARVVMSIKIQTLALMITGLLVLAYNGLLFLICSREDPTLTRIQRVAWGQIILDWLAMVGLVHFTGGITSPALIYFVVHAALSGMILLPWQTRSLSILAITIVGGVTLLERAGWLPHIAISEFGMGQGLYKDSSYIIATMLFFGTTVLILSELVTWNAQRLRQREERIRQLYEARSTFVRVATHELRAPLGASLSLMRNIEQGYAGELSEQQAAILQRVTNRLEGLHQLIDDLLTLAVSREASTAHAPLQPESLRLTLDEIIERERPNIEQKHIGLHCNLADEPGIIMSGNVGLAVVLGNLLNNAVKYTPDGGEVTIAYSINRSAHTTEVTITDTGIGIPADDLPHIFNEFFRAHNARNAQVSGTGIGLSTVRTLIERYHGTITLQSEEGKGTTVHVSLPLAPHQDLSLVDRKN